MKKIVPADYSEQYAGMDGSPYTSAQKSLDRPFRSLAESQAFGEWYESGRWKHEPFEYTERS